ncbi:MAG: pentapeptide repeat-containing protein [Prochlorothrix sp.]
MAQQHIRRSLFRKIWHVTGFQDRSLWEWMELLIFPVLVGVGAVYFEAKLGGEQERQAEEDRKLERSIATDRYQQQALNQYFDRVTKMLEDNDNSAVLAEDEGGATFTGKSDLALSGVEVAIIRSRTLTTLRELDGRRKGLLVQFLMENALIRGENPFIPLDGADLQSANLAELNLSLENLAGADLRRANLRGAYLENALLNGADLRDADLRIADLTNANLTGAQLSSGLLGGAQMLGTILDRADLSGADLGGAYLQDASLYSANLLGASLDNVFLYEADLSETNLYDASLSNAFLEEALLDNARLCQTVQMDGSVSERDCITETAEQPPEVTGLIGKIRQQSAPITDFKALAQEYIVMGMNADGSEYGGYCVLEERGDDRSLQVVWTISSGIYTGVVRVTKDQKLYVSYTGDFAGDGIYALMPDGTIQGVWRGEGSEELGTEIWTPKPRRDTLDISL